MVVCLNRPEGFGPVSRFYVHIVTSCFLDTILVPLCTWLYLIVVIVLLLLFSRRKGSLLSTTKKSTADTETYNGTPARKRAKAQIALLVLYTLLFIAQLLMNILEITRLSLAGLGIGLLPFTLAGIIVAGFLHLTSAFSRAGSRVQSIIGPRRGWTRWVNLAYWVALLVVSVVKIAEEVKEGVGTRVGTKYPMADEVTDVGVMIGVYVALSILEVVS